MYDSYQITSQNDADRVGGNRDAFITVRGPSLPLRTIGISFAAWMAMLGEAVSDDPNAAMSDDNVHAMHDAMLDAIIDSVETGDDFLETLYADGF